MITYSDGKIFITRIFSHQNNNSVFLDHPVKWTKLFV